MVTKMHNIKIMLSKSDQVGKRRKTKRKRVPLNGDTCFFCNSPISDLHEIFRGRNRQLCIDYGLVIGLCYWCHEEITHNPKGAKDNILREYGKEYFKRTYPGLNFKEVFK